MPVAVMSGGSYAQFQKRFIRLCLIRTIKDLYLFPNKHRTVLHVAKYGEWQAIYKIFSPEEKTEDSAMLAESQRMVLTNRRLNSGANKSRIADHRSLGQHSVSKHLLMSKMFGIRPEGAPTGSAALLQTSSGLFLLRA